MPDNPFTLNYGGRSIVAPTQGQGISVGTVVDAIEAGWDYLTGGGSDTATSNLGTNGGQAPASGQTDQYGCAITVPAQSTTRMKCPPGYVVVHPHGQGKQCMLKSAARACGLWKPARKPPIKASDWRCLQKASTVVNRIDNIVKMSNKVTGKAPMRRTRPSRK